MGKDEPILYELAAVCRAVADRNRSRALRVLLSRKDEALSVGELAKILKISQSLTSINMKILKAVGVVDSRKDGNHILYRINEQAIARYWKIGFDLYDKMFKPCPYGFKCMECPEKTTCA